MQDTVPVSVEFTSDTVALLLCKIPQHTEIRTFKTSDAGLNWTAKNLIISANPPYQDIHFYNDTVGIYSTSGFSAITNDRGDSWGPITTNPHGGAPFTSLEDGVFTGVGGAILLYSEDTCQTFKGDTISWGGSANNVTFHQGHFFVSISGNSGYSLGYPYFNFGILVKKELDSDNIVVNHFPELRTKNSTIVNSDEIYVGATDLIGNGRHIVKSEDGGNTWWTQEIINLNEAAWLGIRKIQCLDGDTCIAGDGFSLYKTTNGGGPLLEQVGHQVFLSTDENEMPSENFSIYPNPTSNQLHIASDEQIKNIRIVDLNGRLVYSEKTSSSKTIIQMEELHSGVYVVHVQTTEDAFRKKIVKQ